MTKSKIKPPKKTGRPSLYDAEEHPRVARKLIAEGRGIGALAEALQVSRFTIGQWRTNHPEFSAMIEAGERDLLEGVERSLAERARGYSHPAIKPMVVSDGQGMGSHVEMVGVTEHYPPDPTSIKFFLCNRDPKRWKERTEVAVVGIDKLAERLAAARDRAKAKP